jgi:DNA-directed RNA polymerase subunit M/transcription elongation factor TFIIS
VVLDTALSADGTEARANVFDVSDRRKIEMEKQKLIAELQDALESVEQLSGLLPICANCKKIRSDKGYWVQIEAYIADRSETTFSQGICPDCIPTFEKF